MLDAGSSADWITPTYEAVRNLTGNGRSFCIHSDDWQPIKAELKAMGIPMWGEALHWVDDAHWITVSVSAKHSEIVTELSGYTPNGGRGKALAILLVFVFGVIFCGFVASLMAAALGAG